MSSNASADIPRWKKKKYKEEIERNIWKFSGVALEFSKSPPKSEGIFKCPEDQLPLDYAKVARKAAACLRDRLTSRPATAEIYADPEVNQEIMSGKVRCTHHAEGCRWVDKLQNLQSHLDVCRYDTAPCPNNCSAMLSRICLEDHLQYTCLRRKVTCECCKQEFTGEAMESHQGNCPKEIVWCENKCGARLQRRYLSNHMNNECHKRTVPCHYCQKQFVYETLQDHFYRCPRYPIMCPNRCDPLKIAREELEKHMRDECPSSTVPCTFREAGCKAMVARFSLEKHLQEAMPTHLSLMCTLALQQEKQVAELTRRLATVGRVTDGTLIWKVTGVKAQLAEAKARQQAVGASGVGGGGGVGSPPVPVPPAPELKSDPFYTSRYGYKLGASLFVQGNGSGAGTHLSLYIRMLPGEYDALLEWPFRLPICFQLLDQCAEPEKRAHIFESFVPNPTWKHFARPVKDVESMGFGYPRFAAHETLRSGTYVKDDVLFIKIKVDTSKLIMP